MEKKTLKQRIKENPGLKQAVHRFIMHPVKTRPNWWIRLFDFIYLKRGKGSVIYRSVRKDLPPFNRFFLGKYSVVEDFSCLNNAVGDLTIGDYTRIGLRNTIIGPVHIGNHVNLAQNVTVTGLNHNYQDAEKMIDEQGVKALAALPSREVLLAKLMGSMNAPVTGFVNVLHGTLSGFVRALDAVRAQKEAQ